jgi:hypothetical protein
LTRTQCRIEVPAMDQRLHDFIREPIYWKRTAAALKDIDTNKLQHPDHQPYRDKGHDNVSDPLP